jgi:hypothetical protein
MYITHPKCSESLIRWRWFESALIPDRAADLTRTHISNITCRRRPQTPDDIQYHQTFIFVPRSTSAGHVFNIIMPVNAVAENVFGTMG